MMFWFCLSAFVFSVHATCGQYCDTYSGSGPDCPAGFSCIYGSCTGQSCCPDGWTFTGVSCQDPDATTEAPTEPPVYSTDPPCQSYCDTYSGSGPYCPTGFVCTNRGCLSSACCTGGDIFTGLECKKCGEDCDSSGITNGGPGECSATVTCGTSCEYTCDPGYRASTGSYSAYCQSGTLSASCVAVFCPVNSEGDGAGSTCTCRSGYVEIEPITWNAELNNYEGSCGEAPCDASTPPVNGGVGNCGEVLASRKYCQPSCDSGYTLSRDTFCLRGVLTEATCEVCDLLADGASCSADSQCCSGACQGSRRKNKKCAATSTSAPTSEPTSEPTPEPTPAPTSEPTSEPVTCSDFVSKTSCQSAGCRWNKRKGVCRS